MKFKVGEKIMHLDSERIFEVAEDTTDGNEFVTVLLLCRIGSMMQYVTSRAPINDFVKTEGELNERTQKLR